MLQKHFGILILVPFFTVVLLIKSKLFVKYDPTILFLGLAFLTLALIFEEQSHYLQGCKLLIFTQESLTNSFFFIDLLSQLSSSLIRLPAAALSYFRLGRFFFFGDIINMNPSFAQIQLFLFHLITQETQILPRHSFHRSFYTC